MNEFFRHAGFVLVLLALAGNHGVAQETNAPTVEKPTNAPIAVTPKENGAAALPAKDTDTNAITTVNAVETNSIATAKVTTAASALTLESFRLIYERNIFDQSRESRSSRSSRPSRSTRGEETRRAPRVESFALVGTMSYEKGTFAFFDGSSSQYRKALKVGDSIASYQVKDVTQSQVKLASEKQELELNVGQQLRREDEGEWQVSARSAETGSSLSASAPAGNGDSTSGASASSPAAAASSDSGGASDLLKRLMQQREKELNK